MAAAWMLGGLGATPAEAAPREVERLATRGQTVAILVAPLVNPALADPLVSRIEAELTAVGIRVRRFELPPGADVEAAVASAMAGGASAALRVIPRSRGTEVWTSDTTARVLRRRAINADSPDAALSVLAIRTVEFLRASLLEIPRSRLRPAPAPPEPETAAAPQDRVATVAPPARPSPPPPAPPPLPPSPPPLPPPMPPPRTATALAPASPRPLPSEAVGAREAAPPTPSAGRQAESPPEARSESDRPEARHGAPTVDRPAVDIRASDRGAEAAANFARPWVELQVGVAWLLSYHSRQLGAATDYALAARIPLGHGIAIGAEGLVPAVAQETNGGGGTTTFRAYRVGLAMTCSVPLPVSVEASRFRLETGLAAGAIYGSIHGYVDPSLGSGYHGYHPTKWVGSAALAVGPSVALTSWLLARLNLGVGLTTRRIGVFELYTADPNEVGGVGPVYGLGSVALQATW